MEGWNGSDIVGRVENDISTGEPRAVLSTESGSSNPNLTEPREIGVTVKVRYSQGSEPSEHDLRITGSNNPGGGFDAWALNAPTVADWSCWVALAGAIMDREVKRRLRELDGNA